MSDCTFCRAARSLALDLVPEGGAPSVASLLDVATRRGLLFYAAAHVMGLHLDGDGTCGACAVMISSFVAEIRRNIAAKRFIVEDVAAPAVRA